MSTPSDGGIHQEALLSLLIDQIREHAIVEMDAGGAFLNPNRSQTRVFGYSVEELQGGNLAMLYPPEMRNPERVAEVLQIATRRGRFEEQATYQRRSGQRFQGYTVIVPIAGTNNYAVVVHDMAVLLATHDQLHALATADQLTGLHNRQHLFDLGRVEYRRWRRYRVPMSMIVADVDGLGEINETHGTDEGDAILRDVADVMRQCVRDVDLVARIDGGLYAVMLFSTPQEGAAVLAERIRNYLHRSAFQLKGQQCKVTMCLTVMTANEGNPDFDSFYKAAEQALKAIKKEGRDRISLV